MTVAKLIDLLKVYDSDAEVTIDIGFMNEKVNHDNQIVATCCVNINPKRVIFQTRSDMDVDHEIHCALEAAKDEGIPLKTRIKELMEYGYDKDDFKKYIDSYDDVHLINYDILENL